MDIKIYLKKNSMSGSGLHSFDSEKASVTDTSENDNDSVYSTK
jgi:hypothetical protein